MILQTIWHALALGWGTFGVWLIATAERRQTSLIGLGSMIMALFSLAVGLICGGRP